MLGCFEAVGQHPAGTSEKNIVFTFRFLKRTQPKTSNLQQLDILTPCNILDQQADIRMRSHGLRQLVDDKSVASCQQTCCKLSTDLLQVDCQNLLSTGLLQVVSTSCNKSANEK